MPDYAYREVGTDEVELAVFRETSTPTEIYTVKGNRCDCPAGRRGCKHPQIVADFREYGELTEGVEGLILDTDTKIFYRLPFGLIDRAGVWHPEALDRLR